MRPACFVILFAFASLPMHAAVDTLHITLARADSIFLKENLLLLSQAYSIGAREALIVQSKAYPNPVFSAQLNAFDSQHEHPFNIGPDGQKEFAIEQLIVMGGKRKSSIAIARQHKEIAESELAELLRNLKLQLHSSFYNLAKHRAILGSYRQQLVVLEELIASYEEQAKRGNLPVKDVIRLKSVHLRISNNRIEETVAYLEESRKIQILLNTTRLPSPVLDDAAFTSFLVEPEFARLFELAQEYRPDFDIARKERSLAASMLRLQRQMAIPDVSFNTAYDQQGGAFKNQVQVGVAIPLPLWNRNKGNIKAATFDEMNAELFIELKRNEIQTQVLSAVEQMKAIILAYGRASQLYTNDFNEVFRGINENFSRRNISILEFVDFFEAYNESLADYQKIKTQLAVQAEQINHVTAYPVY